MSGIPIIDDIVYLARKIAKSRLRLETQLKAGLAETHPTVQAERDIAKRELKRLSLLLESAVEAGDLPAASQFASILNRSDDEEDGDGEEIAVLAVAAIMEAAAEAGGE